jgi:hypothetical protein
MRDERNEIVSAYLQNCRGGPDGVTDPPLLTGAIQELAA